MFIGHYLTALVPYSIETRKKPPSKVEPTWRTSPILILVLLLVAAQLPDLVLAILGLNQDPADVYDPAQAAMTYSHDLLPVTMIALGGSAIMWIITQDRRLALWAIALVIIHFVADFVSGFEHYVHGPETASLGLDLYTHSLATAVGIELAYCAGLLAWYVRREQTQGTPLTRQTVLILIVLVVLTTALSASAIADLVA